MSRLNKKFKEKTEINRTLSMMKKQISTLERHQKEYIERAKAAKLKGNNQLYNNIRTMIKTTMVQSRRLEIMQMNIEFAISQRDFAEHNRNFIIGMRSLGKSLMKTIKLTDIMQTSKILEKSMAKVNESLSDLDLMLDSNNSLFESATDSGIADSEIDALIGSEAIGAENDIDARLDELFGEVGTSEKKTVPVINSETLIEQDGGQLSLKSAQSDNVPNHSETTVKTSDSINERYNRTNSELPKDKKQFNVTGAAYRPQRLGDYIGQPNAVATISDPIKKALLMDKPLPHILLCGSYGQGKTTLAKIIANEMSGNFIEITASVKYRDMLRTLRDIKAGDIIFIDEIHKLSTEIIETLLYPAMEDFEIHYTESNSMRTKSRTQKISPFTLIGATTETGKLLKPFYNKFPINITLSDYQLETIAAIVQNSFRVLGIEISDELAFSIAKRSRLTPRTANAFVEGIASSAIVREAEKRNLTTRGALNNKDAVAALKIKITSADVENYFNNMGIDELGLKEEDRKILRVIITMYNGGPVGQDNIAKALNMSNNRIDQEYEPYLVKLGFINVRPQGRYTTDAAYKYMGLKPEKANEDNIMPDIQSENEIPNAIENSSNQNRNSSEEQISSEDNLPLIECEIGTFNEKAAERFNILFSGEATPCESTLDELFPDIDKNYDSIAKNQCCLKVSNGRQIYCDSKLERRFLSYLFKNGYILDAKAEALELGYASSNMSGKKYYPDFVLKLYDGSIAVIEMKNLSSMGYHLNVDKYEALEKFCRKNDYKYAEISKDFHENRYISAEQLKKRPINKNLKNLIINKIEQNGFCSEADLLELNFDICDLITLLLNDRSIKNIDRTGNNPQIISTNV